MRQILANQVRFRNTIERFLQTKRYLLAFGRWLEINLIERQKVRLLHLMFETLSWCAKFLLKSRHMSVSSIINIIRHDNDDIRQHPVDLENASPRRRLPRFILRCL